MKKVAPRDLLAPDAPWNFPKNVKGFQFLLERGSARIIGPDADAKADGIVSIGDVERWRDFVLDFSFTLVKGEATVYMRLGQIADSRVESFELKTTGQSALVAGQRYKAEVSMIGSTRYVNIVADGFTPETVQTVAWAHSRKGAIGIVVPSDTELDLSEMKIRVLR